jgi:hypothetical protein
LPSTNLSEFYPYPIPRNIKRYVRIMPDINQPFYYDGLASNHPIS